MVLMFGAGLAPEGDFGDSLVALGLGIVLGALPVVYIRIRRKRRMKAFAANFPMRSTC